MKVFQEEALACAVSEPQQLQRCQAELPVPIALSCEGMSNLARKSFFKVRRPGSLVICWAGPAALRCTSFHGVNAGLWQRDLACVLLRITFGW